MSPEHQFRQVKLLALHLKGRTAMRRCVLLVTVALCFTFITAIPVNASDDAIDSLAKEYVRLVLCVGRYVPDYVDAYFGPVELKEAAAREEVEKGFPYQRLCLDAERLLSAMHSEEGRPTSDSDKLRLAYMTGQLDALRAVLDIHRGNKLPFDQEVAVVYGVRAPRRDSVYYEELLAELDSLLPGEGDLTSRFIEFRDKFLVPSPFIDTVLKCCFSECRERTRHFVAMPQGEFVRVELVGGQSWGGYNWYMGDLESLVQFDTTSLPNLESVLELAAHEGYPGHHLSNIVREKHLVKDSGWVEFSVCLLFCPQSVLDEGLACVAPDLVLPLKERISFFKTTIFPILGLDTSLAEPYCRVTEARKRLDEVDLDIARNYLDGTFDSTRAINWLCRYTLTSRDGALRSLRFTEDYRSYQVTYTVGEELVRGYMTRHGGTPDNPGKQWGLFYRLISSPLLPADLE
jgi:hypothetical protein